MPYDASKPDSLPAPVQKLPATKQRQWVNVWNSSYSRCMEGKSGNDAQQTCETSAFRQANGVVIKGGSSNNSAGFSADDLASAPATQVAAFELPSEPGAAYDDGETVYRYGRIFRAGTYPDKAFEMTPDELRAAVERFDGPVPIDIEHVPSVLDGKLGQVVHVEASDDGEELHGIVALPKWLDSILDERKVSATWDRATKSLRALALVRNPRVSDAALMAAFSSANKCDECGDADFAQWDTAYINDLPDSSFLYIESGGTKDEEGKTTPRSLRHFPYKDADGKIDLPHLRNAIARIPQSDVPNKDALQKRAQNMLERANSGIEHADLIDAMDVLFAPAKHQTPEGQAQLQQLHNLAAQYGAVCKASNAVGMASSSEARAIQGIHDATMAAGAMCSKISGNGNGMSPAYPFSGEQDANHKGGSRMSTVFERFMAFLGSEAPVGDDAPPNPQGEPAPQTAGTGPQVKPEAKMSQEQTNAAAEREARLLAELASERERSRRLEAERIHEKAVAFSDNLLRVEKRILPASQGPLTTLFEQLAIADGKMPAVTFNDGSTDTYVGLLTKFVASLPKSPLTEELLSGSLHETIVALANRQQATTPDTDRKLTQDELDAMLARIPTGRALLAERNKNGKG